MHASQLTVSVETVRELVDEQFPEWRGLTVMGVASQGTVNALFRIGEKFLARFPLEPLDAGSAWRWLEAEAQAARALLGSDRTTRGCGPASSAANRSWMFPCSGAPGPACGSCRAPPLT
jgi:hypothetical protein